MNSINNKNGVLKRVSDSSGKRRPVSFDCRVKINQDKSKVTDSKKPKYGALLKFPKGVEASKLTLKTGLYFLNNKVKNRTKSQGNPSKECSLVEENGIFVWNPSRKAILPVLGVAMAMGDLTRFKNRILIFKRKRRRPGNARQSDSKKLNQSSAKTKGK